MKRNRGKSITCATNTNSHTRHCRCRQSEARQISTKFQGRRTPRRVQGSAFSANGCGVFPVQFTRAWQREQGANQCGRSAVCQRYRCVEMCILASYVWRYVESCPYDMGGDMCMFMCVEMCVLAIDLSLTITCVAHVFVFVYYVCTCMYGGLYVCVCRFRHMW